MPRKQAAETESIVFNGITFRRYPNSNSASDRNYYRADGRLHNHGIIYLHREIWKFHNGEIPEGYHVHHKDENPLNNDISNLELLVGHEHISQHVRKNHMEVIRPKAAEWHRSEEGRECTKITDINALNEKPKSQKLNASVPNAGRNFTRRVTDETIVNTAQMPVAQSTDETTGLTTKQEFVSFVVKNSELTNMAKSKHVAENVAVSVVGIHEEKRTADVYNLTVDGEHEYFANGFLVYNCYDAVAYGCLSRPFAPMRKKQGREFDDWRTKKKRSVWTY